MTTPSAFILSSYAKLHVTGEHCGSTAMRNLLRFHTHTRLDEPSVLGLSGAIWFCAVAPPLTPTTITFGRTLTLETGICENLGLPYVEQPAADDDAWPDARDALLEGTPVVLTGDSSKLDYFGGPPFPGHRFLLVGYNESWGVAIVGDRKWPELQRVSLESLARSRSMPGDPLSVQNLWGRPTASWPDADEIDERARQAVQSAVRQAAERMLDPSVDATGVAGMRTLAERVPTWSEQELVRFATTNEFVVERAGNGGGLFRRMYAAFLNRYAAQLGQGGSDLSPRFEQLADRWTELATLLGETARAAAPTDRAADIGAAFVALAELEQQAWSRCLDAAK